MKPERETRTWWGEKKRGNRVLHTNAAILDILWFSYFFVLFLPLKRGKCIQKENETKTKEGRYQRKWTCVFGEFLCTENNIWNLFLSLMAAKATGNMWNKALISCNLNIQEGGERFSTQAAAVHLTHANTFPWHQRVSADHLFKMKSMDVLLLKHIF